MDHLWRRYQRILDVELCGPWTYVIEPRRRFRCGGAFDWSLGQCVCLPDSLRQILSRYGNWRTKEMNNPLGMKTRRIALIGGVGMAASLVAFSLQGGGSATATTGTLNAPVLSFTADSAGIHLHWTDNSTGEASFAVYRLSATEGSWTNKALHATRSASGVSDAWSWLDAGASVTDWYCYQVRSINNVGVQASSDPACTM